MSRPLYVIYGHHKCATMWLEGIARHVAQVLGLRFRVVYNEDQFGHDLPRWVASQGVQMLLYGSADIQYARPIGAHRGIHIVRDPRDITVSAYFSHRYSHSTSGWKELITHREKLKILDKDAGLAEEIRFRARSFGHIADWDYGQEHVLEIRFEDIVRGSYETLLDCFDFLGLVDEREEYDRAARAGFPARDTLNRTHARSRGWLPLKAYPARLPGPELLAIAWHHRFQRRARGRQQGAENVQSHYRKGQPGDWRNHFNDAHRELFKSLYPGLVPKLGYAPDDAW
jgi:hypothetical protein